MRIKEARKKRNMTLRQLGEAIGVDHSVVSRYESGKINPPADKMEAISKVLDVPIDFLFGEELLIETKEAKRPGSFTSDLEINFDSSLAKRMLAYTQGICELCGHSAPFRTKYGIPYLEIHLIKEISDGGMPIPENTVALCPNCHARIHILRDPKDTEKLLTIAKTHSF